MHILKFNVANYNQEVSGYLKKLCIPLLGYFKEFSVGYTRQYHDGRLIILETQIEWLNLKLNCYLHDEVLVQNLQNAQRHREKEYVYILTGAPTNLIHTQLFNFDIWNGISLHYSTQEFDEAFHFGTTRNNLELINLYVNEKNLFNHLVFYIREHFAELKIQQAPLIEVGINNQQTPPTHMTQMDKNSDGINIENFLKGAPIKKYYLQNYNFYLTKREIDCIYYLRKGFTVKHIAKALNISPRTVEYYINEVKIKVGAQYKNDILNLFQNNSFLNCWVVN